MLLGFIYYFFFVKQGVIFQFTVGPAASTNWPSFKKILGVQKAPVSFKKLQLAPKTSGFKKTHNLQLALSELKSFVERQGIQCLSQFCQCLTVFASVFHSFVCTLSLFGKLGAFSLCLVGSKGYLHIVSPQNNTLSIGK